MASRVGFCLGLLWAVAGLSACELITAPDRSQISTGDLDTDGVEDGTDNCPDNANADQLDTDADASGDICDTDDDGDGALDADDAFPTDPEESVDSDGDGAGNNGDVDDDNDGLSDADEADAGTDPLDADSDDDGFNDNAELAAGSDPLDAASTPDTAADLDGDGMLNAADNCPSVPNPDQDNADDDASGDACDVDDDNDGEADADDNCPMQANADQLDNDNDAQGDACDLNDDDDAMPDLSDPFPLDRDNDTINDALDNCKLAPNLNQANFDEDASGDACDSDDDNDGTGDTTDAFPFDPAETVDTDDDGLGNNADTDDDDDGLSDSAEATAGSDPLLQDTDGDGFTDAIEVAAGTDPDDYLDYPSGVADQDNDGQVDASDNCPAVHNVNQTNSDTDELGDACDSDDDNDGVSDVQEGLDGSNPTLADTDEDGLSDGVEKNLGTNPLDTDSDDDLLADAEEVAALTDPLDADTDDDAWDDGEEINFATDPLDPGSYPGAPEPDNDGDTLSNGLEVLIGTNPNDADSDNDNWNDALEYAEGTDPLDGNYYPGADFDLDGLPNVVEALYGTDENDADSDDDGLSDGWEVHVSGTDPLDPLDPAPDPDGDGLSEAQEDALGTDPNLADTDADGLWDGDEANYGTDATVADTDGDSQIDGDEVNWGWDPLFADADNDGLGDAEEVDYQTDPNWADTDNDSLQDGAEVNLYGTDPTNYDTDGDGFNDGIEILQYGTNPLDASDPTVDSDGDGLFDNLEPNFGTDVSNPDTDGDGISDGIEAYNTGTDPLLSDTDGDTYNDWQELNITGTDPLDPNDYPRTDPISENGPFSCCYDHGEYFDRYGQDYPAPLNNWTGLFRRVESTSLFSLHPHETSDLYWYDITAPRTDQYIGIVQNDLQVVNSDLTTSERFALVARTSGYWDSHSQRQLNGTGHVWVWLHTTTQPHTYVVVYTINSDGCDPNDECFSVGASVEIKGVEPIFASDITDDDSDGVPSDVETFYGMDDTDADSDGDATDDLRELRAGTAGDDDNDGLVTWQEELYGTEPTNPDTDGDSLSDGDEVQAGFDPTDPTSPGIDTDADGLYDFQEEFYGGIVTMADTDGDGLNDGTEVQYGTDVTVADTDGDGLEDGYEVNSIGTDPLEPDTDNDGSSDFDENAYVTDPLNPRDFYGALSWDDALANNTYCCYDTDYLTQRYPYLNGYVPAPMIGWSGLLVRTRAQVSVYSLSVWDWRGGYYSSESPNLLAGIELPIDQVGPGPDIHPTSAPFGLREGFTSSQMQLNMPVAERVWVYPTRETDVVIIAFLHNYCSIASTCYERGAVFELTGARALSYGETDDSDDDQLLNGAEATYGSATTSYDTDGDGFPDGFEAAWGSDPADNQIPGPDSDGDYFADYFEAQFGTYVDDVDSDRDGLWDADEAVLWNSNPLMGDSDGDGYGDALEQNEGFDPANPVNPYRLDPLDIDNSAYSGDYEHGEWGDRYGSNAYPLPAPVQGWSGLFERTDTVVQTYAIHTHEAGGLTWYSPSVPANQYFVGSIDGDSTPGPIFAPTLRFGLVFSFSGYWQRSYSQYPLGHSPDRLVWLYPTPVADTWVVAVAYDTCADSNWCYDMGGSWEIKGVRPLLSSQVSDSDHDGILNATEDVLGTNKNSLDSDGDRLPDGMEIILGLAPLDATADTDGDGSDDVTELRSNNTDPTQP